MEEDHGNHALTVALLASLKLFGRQGDPNGEGTSHTTASNQEQLASADAVNHIRPEPGFEHVAHEDEAIKHVLVGSAGITDVVEDVGEVVCCETGSGEL